MQYGIVYVQYHTYNAREYTEAKLHKESEV